MRKLSIPIRTDGSFHQAVFSSLIVYYWVLQYMSNWVIDVTVAGTVAAQESIIYYLHVGPIALFSLVSFFGMIASVRIGISVQLLLLLMVVVSGVAFLRSDFQTVASVGLLALTVAVIFAYRLAPPIRLLNVMFLISIVASAGLYALGWSSSTIIPGYSLDGLWWRISLFPSVATSAFFSLIILFGNLLYDTGRLRKLCIILSAYFLIFSGLRTAVLVGGLAGVYCLLSALGWFTRYRTKVSYLIFSVVVLIGSFYVIQLLMLFPDLGTELNLYLFRASNSAMTDEEAALLIFRTLLWAEHFRIAQDNLLFGIGTFDFTALSDELGKLSIGSESFVTGLYARVGAASVLLVLAFVVAIAQGIKSGRHIHLVVGLFLFAAMFAYGGFIAVYDFVFLVMVALIAPERTHVLRPGMPPLDESRPSASARI